MKQHKLHLAPSGTEDILTPTRRAIGTVVISSASPAQDGEVKRLAKAVAHLSMARVTGDTPEAVTAAPAASTTGGAMNADPRSSQGVSGMGSPIPDQGALDLSPKGDKTPAQSCNQSRKARQLRVYLSAAQAQRWLELPPSKRSRAVAAVLGSVEAGIDLQRLIDAVADLRKIGVLLNQAVRLGHQDRAPFDFSERVEAAVAAIEALKP